MGSNPQPPDHESDALTTVPRYIHIHTYIHIYIHTYMQYIYIYFLFLFCFVFRLTAHQQVNIFCHLHNIPERLEKKRIMEFYLKCFVRCANHSLIKHARRLTEMCFQLFIRICVHEVHLKKDPHLLNNTSAARAGRGLKLFVPY